MAKSKTQVSRRALRIAALRSRIQKQTAASKPVETKKRVFASLEHLLNATALYQMGEFDRATVAFQKAMAEADAPAMLESLEGTQSCDTIPEPSGGSADTGISFDVPAADPLPVDDLSDEYLSDDEFSTIDANGTALEADVETTDEISDDEPDLASSQDNLSGDSPTEEVIPAVQSMVSVAARVRNNLVALAQVRKELKNK